MAFSISRGEPSKLPMPNGSPEPDSDWGRAAGAGGGGWLGGADSGSDGENGSAPNRSFESPDGDGRGGGAARSENHLVTARLRQHTAGHNRS